MILKRLFTTYPDLQTGIKNVLDSLDQELLKNVNLVSVSTTLSTNSLLEGTGTSVALIIIGEKPAQTEFPAEFVICVKGGHDTRG